MKKLFFSAFLFTLIISGCKKNDGAQTDPADPADGKFAASFDITNLVSSGVIREGNICDFKNSSTGATSYKWNFGNSSVSTEKSPSNQSFVPCGGTYTITLTAISNAGRMTTCSHSYTILCRGKMAHQPGVELPPTHYSTEELKKIPLDL